MKNRNGIFILIFTLFGLQGVLAQLDNSHCDSLIKKKQYLSAFDYLQKIDVENKNPDIVLKKVDLALNYNVKNIRNHLFAFVDLRDGEELDRLRETLREENFSYFEFKPDTVLLQLTQKLPSNYRLIKALGDFYYNTYKNMGDRWFISARQLLEKYYYYYKSAYEHGVYDAESSYALAFYNSVFGNYAAADEWYLKSLELDTKNALTVYGYGVNCLLNKKSADGIRPMLVAYGLFEDSLKKGDAARLLGIMYYKSGMKEKALEMFWNADKLSPAYHPNQMFLLRSQLQLGEDGAALALSKTIFEQAPVDPDAPDELLEMFRKEGKGELLESLFKSLLKEYKNNHEANGNLRFHYGKLLFLEGNPKKAVRMFKKSHTQFSKVLPPDHHVFKMLDDMIKKIRSRSLNGEFSRSKLEV